MTQEEFEVADYKVSIWGHGDRHIVVSLPKWLGDMAMSRTKGGLGARAAIAEFAAEPLRAVYGSDLEPVGEIILVTRAPAE